MGSPASTCRKNDIGMTMPRSPVYAHHDPTQLDPEADTPIGPGRPDSTASTPTAELEEAPCGAPPNSTNRPSPSSPQAAPRARSRFRILREPNRPRAVTVLKQLEDAEQTTGSNGLVVRAYETAGAATHATIALPGVVLHHRSRLRPGEIKTWRVSANGTPVEVNLLEELKQR